jgi:hypothetical protein
MHEGEAIKVIESLRKGIPPDGHVRHFTVGRESEINQLVDRLQAQHTGSLLLKANYGSGKSHLLRFLRETALSEGYAVSTVTLDAKSAVRFNKMNQIVGAIWRGLEIPGAPGERGIRPFFNHISKSIEDSRKRNDTQSFWYQLSNNWEWDYSEALDSPAFFVALRAWKFGGGAVHDKIQDWFFQPWVYQTQRKQLYEALVEDLRRNFRDPRQCRQFYEDDVFAFDRQGYQQSWAVLRDAQKLAQASGLKGFIILFDEFEDVLTNLRNIAHQEAAFWNLFQFYSGKQFPSMTFFAVTPEFVVKCKWLLQQRGRWDYDYSRFDDLPTFAMSPLEQSHLELLALKIAQAHGAAYGWQPESSMTVTQLQGVVAKAAAVQVQDRARHTIREVVTALDRLLEDGQ